MKPPAAGKGRPKGVPNKLTRSAKEAFALAFDGIGGAEALIAWARDNPTDFYKLYARLIPTEANVSVTAQAAKPEELSDEQLVAIASGAGAIAPQTGTGKPH